MRYLADLLTLTRLILAIVLLVLAFTGGSPEAAFIIFIVAELTDSVDGTCAMKWPFPNDKPQNTANMPPSLICLPMVY